MSYNIRHYCKIVWWANYLQSNEEVGEGNPKRTHAFLTSSSFKGPETLNPRAIRWEAKSDSELSESVE